jgi:hypothetical protein
MKKLVISKEVSLADDIVTKTVAILAQRRKGKTYTASVIAEEMVVAKVPFVVLDPTGAWWGLRSSADGKKPGLPVVILGGQHGDLPLERGAGKFIADLVLDHPGWYVIDFSLFESGGAERQFATDFAERLYRRKGQPGMDFPLHLFVDEADRFVPQRVSGGRGEGRESDQRMLGAFEAIVRRGGLRGLGTTLISQRAAVVNKNVLEQIDLLIALRIMGPNDRRAIEDYLKADADDDQRKALMASLGSLDIGEAWLWEPGGEPPLFDRVRIRERHTFNSSATPKPGQRRVEPSKFAEVDLDAVKNEMAAAIERASADDPKALKRRIAELERLVAQKSPASPAPKVEIRTETVEVQVPFIPESIPKMIGEFRAATEKFFSNIETAIFDAATSKPPVAPARRSPSVVREPAPKVPITVVPARRSPPTSTSIDGDARLPKAEKTILTVLAQFPDGRSRRQLAMLSGYSSKSGGFNNALAKLRTAGLINKAGEPVKATPDGLAAIDGTYEPLPTGRALLDHWNSKLGKAERMILGVCIDAWPESLTRDQVAEITGYSGASGGFNNALAKLRTLELITRGTEIFADETLAQEVHNG